MNPSEYNALHVIHLLSLFFMVGAIFYGCVAAPETRKKTLMWSGIAALLVVATGVRMALGIYQTIPVWAWVKVVCWLGLAAFVGLAYKRREKTALWIELTLILVAVALVMVYYKPFTS
ncbi:MAG TPA: hypothetical protein VHD62_10500 [Opitutaceae bacterium]|nr:hypothetical protein [Opitutaceae bacterium]